MATTTDLTTLKINYLSQAQYDDALANNLINSNELYLTPFNISVNGASIDAVSFFAPVTSGTTNQILVSGGAGNAPTWLATANGAAYATSTNGSLTFGTLPVPQGGTGLNSLTQYSIYYASSADTFSAITNNTTTTRKFLRMTGTGSVGAAPAWDTVTKTDVGLENVANVAQVTAISWDSTNKKITRTISGTAADVVQFAAGDNITLTGANGKLTIASTNTDTLVKQTSKTDSVAYKLLMTTSASPTSGNAYESSYSTTLSYNPSTKVLTNGTITLTSASSTTADTSAYDVLKLGNATNVTSTTAHSEGKINLYSAATKSHIIVGKSTTTDYTHTLPNKTGIIVTLNGTPANNIGAANQSIYVTSEGVVTAGNTYYAPSTAGTSGQLLQSNGTNTMPDWINTVGVAHGGTGATSFTANSVIMSGNTTTAALTTKGITDNSSNTDVTSSDTNLITGRTLYYQLAKKDYACLDSPVFTGTPKSVTPTSSSDNKMIATKEYVDNSFAVNDAMLFKGVVNTNSNLPANHKQGWTYKVETAGTYAGKVCEIGDMIICITDGTSANNDHWVVIQNNVDGAIFKGTNIFTDTQVLIADGTNGKIKTSGYTIAKSVPNDAKFTDTTYSFSGGTNKITITPLNGTAQDITITPSITNNITGSGTNNYLAKFNNTNTLTNGPQLGSSTTTFLRNDGTWATPSGAVTGVKGSAESSYRTGQVDLTAANVGAITKNETGNTQQLVRPIALNGVNDITYQALINDVRANRLAFLPADQIIIEKTTDGGNTWVDGGFTDAQKIALFTEKRHYSMYLPKINNLTDTRCGLRITITAMKYNVPAEATETQKYNYWNSNYVTAQERYCQLKMMYFWVSTAYNSIKIKIERATGAASTTWNTIFDKSDYGMKGWSGNNIITFSQNSFGGGINQTTNYWNYRMTLMSAGPTDDLSNISSNTTTSHVQQIIEIRGYGDTWWGKSNEYMASDHIYGWDDLQNTIFPAAILPKNNNTQSLGNSNYKWANVYATTFTGDLTGNITGTATNVTGTIAISNGGTGATNAVGARTNLGLGSMATEIATDYLKLSGGTMTGNLLGNATTTLGSTTNPFHQLILGGATNATMTADSTNPRITFQESNNGSQPVHLIYTDYDSYRSPAGLKIIGGSSATPAWLEVEGNIYASTFNGYTIAASVPSDAVFTDTKNTAGSTNSTSKLFIIGATSQAANPTTNSYQYTYTNNGLLSALKLGLNLNGTEKAHLEWNDTDQSIDFVFN